MIKEYSYNGPVEEFGRCIANNGSSSTRAVSEEKARSNLVYQFKKQNKMKPYAKINLPGKIVAVN